MLRFIIQCIEVDENIGLRNESYKTIDVDVPEVEEVLKSGTKGPSGFKMFYFTGIEIMPPNADGK